MHPSPILLTCKPDVPSAVYCTSSNNSPHDYNHMGCGEVSQHTNERPEDELSHPSNRQSPTFEYSLNPKCYVDNECRVGMVKRSDVSEALPEIDEIADDDLRETVIDCWVLALDEGNFETLEEIPWWPPYEEAVGEKYLLDHLRNDSNFAMAMVDILSERIPNIDLDRDMVIAGALLHDISKLFETSHEGMTELGNWIPHPHFSVYILASNDVPLPIQHIVLGHTPRSSVQLQTLEGQIVQIADELGGKGWFWAEANRLDPGVYGSDR